MARESKVDPAFTRWERGEKTGGKRTSAYSREESVGNGEAEYSRSRDNLDAERMDRGMPLTPRRKR